MSIKRARNKLGDFIATRRQQMGRSRKELADHLGVSAETVKGVETGRFAADIDLILRICEALELKPFFAPMEVLRPISPPAEGKFLVANRPGEDELYILHTGYPACLIKVVQTIPTTLQLVFLFDDIEEEDLAFHPFWEATKVFLQQLFNGATN